MQQYGIVKIVFEIPPSGKWKNKMEFTVLTNRYIYDFLQPTLAAEIILVGVFSSRSRTAMKTSWFASVHSETYA
jgi:hypothetical protein